MFLWSARGRTPRIFGMGKRNRGEPRENTSHLNDAKANKNKRNTAVDMTIRGFEQIHCQTRRKSPTVLRPDQESDNFKWNNEAEAAFEHLKKVITTPPV